MSVLSIHRIQRRYSGVIATTIDASATSVVLESITSLETFQVPAYLRCASEWLEVTAYAVDTPAAGKATLTVTRGANGSSAASHAAGATVSAVISDWEITEAQDRLLASQAIVGVDSAATGVQRTDSVADLAVVAAGTPDMTVSVGAGSGIVEGQPVQAAATALSFSGPSANPRIDIVTITQYGVIGKVSGTEAASPSAPATPAGSMLLAEVHHRVGESSIKNASDGTNGYITDKRDFV